MEISVSVTDTFLSPNCTFSDLRMNYPAVKNADTFIKNNKNMYTVSVFSSNDFFNSRVSGWDVCAHSSLWLWPIVDT